MTTVTEPGTATRRVPWLTLAATLVTAAGFAWQLADPHVLELLRRDPAGLHAGNLWRVVTPLLIQSDGWVQAIVNLVTLVGFGAVVERYLGRPIWLVAYLGAGIVGQWVGYSWNPPGGGNSVAVCGLVGALVAATLLGRPALPTLAIFVVPYYSVALMGYAVAGVTGQEIGLVATAIGVGLGAMVSRRQGRVDLLGRVFALVVLAEAVVLVAYRDHHGAALLTGVAIGLPLALAGGGGQGTARGTGDEAASGTTRGAADEPREARRVRTPRLR